MFIFAHVFIGALIGLVFLHLTGDRRALPVSVFGAILPDLLDKPLSILLPSMLGYGRDLGHTLAFCTITLALGLILWQYRHTLLGIACACAVFSHQVLDSMWTLPATWFFPFGGFLPTSVEPDYVPYHFWLEISSLSEWIYAIASLWLIGAYFLPVVQGRKYLTARSMDRARAIVAILLGAMGVCLLLCGVYAHPAVLVAPAYDPVTDVMAGIMTLWGSAAFFSRALHASHG